MGRRLTGGAFQQAEAKITVLTVSARMVMELLIQSRQWGAVISPH